MSHLPSDRIALQPSMPGISSVRSLEVFRTVDGEYDNMWPIASWTRAAGADQQEYLSFQFSTSAACRCRWFFKPVSDSCRPGNIVGGTDSHQLQLSSTYVAPELVSA